MKSVEQGNFAGKKVIVRCDFDVPMEMGKISDLRRVETTAQTLKFLRGQGASLSLISHLGRPEGPDPKDSLIIIKEPLEKFLGEKITFCPELIANSSPVSLFENLRFYPEEEANDTNFAKKLASLGEVYVNECFSVVHRAHASVDALPELLPAFAGLDLQRETKELSQILDKPKRPLVAIIGGAKIETKLPTIINLAKIADKVLVGGRLMFEIDKTNLPGNVLVANDDIEQKDIGPTSLEIFKTELATAKMIVWNGPMGMFEDSRFAAGTKKLAEMVAHSSAYSVVGGGDTISALDEIGMTSKVDFVCLGGGAMLEFLEGKKLPGLIALGFYE